MVRYQRRGLSAVFLPYLYSFVIVPLSYRPLALLPGGLSARLTSPDWSVARLVQKANGAYQQALARVQQAGESCGLSLQWVLVSLRRGHASRRGLREGAVSRVMHGQRQEVLDQHAASRVRAEQTNWVTPCMSSLAELSLPALT